MALSLTNVQQQEFDELVKIEYHSRGFILRDTMRLRTDVIGNTVQFRKVGQVIALPTGYQQNLNLQDPGFTGFVATLIKYTAPTGVDEIQDLTVNFDTKRELAMIVAMAIGRRSDQIMINAQAANPSLTVAVNAVPAGAAVANANLTYFKLRQVVAQFEANAVPVGERFCACSGNNLAALLADDHIVSRFYTSNDAVVDGQLNYKELLGMNFRIIPTMAEGGLPLAGTVRTVLAWHKMSAGMGIGQDMRVEIHYIPQMTTWLVNGLFFAGAVTVDNLGVYAILADESVNP
jgi:hypothetical protein